ncbi:transposable element Tcb2 transposase [Trichonephila clavipes]|nr:transposable element Tcb2 transposase [Trichonephila clavipes]
MLSYLTTAAAQENQRLSSEKPKVYNDTAKMSGAYTAWIAFGARLSERCPVPIDSDKRRSTVNIKNSNPCQLTARRNRTENATQLQRQLLLATGRRVSSQTVRNRLHEGGLYARRPMVCIPLTPRPRAARRRWAAEHRDWEQHDWSQVLFTDESLFSLECDTRRVLVWRDRGTRNNPAFVRERSQYRRAGWMVWGGISIGGRTDLHIIRNGTLTGRRYADEILRPHVIPYAGAIGDSFVFQNDNARPHRARLVEYMLEAETIQRMEMPACSPDLNPIEHVWDMLRRRIAARPRPPATVRDLEIALLEEWNSIPQSLIDYFIASMANRCAAVLAVRGDHTPY